MGEFADYAVEECLTMEDFRLDYRLGFISHGEAYEKGVIDERGYEHHPYPTPTTKTCKCCGQSGLTWGNHGGKWRLFDGGSVHRCPVNPLRD